jgi:hypothetical protein
MKEKSMFNLVSAVKIFDGKKVFVIVPNIKQFKLDVIAQFGSRENKRWDFEKQFHYKLNDFVRETFCLQKKHIKIHLVAPAEAGFQPEDGRFRNEKGHFVKIEK